MSHAKPHRGISRRNLLLLTGSGVLATGLAIEWVNPVASIAAAAGPITPDRALKQLMAGNQRYVAKKLAHPHQNPARLVEVAKGQHPFAVVLGCADSRVPPEIIFDQGLGDLFVLRVAGNILDGAILGSIEYAIEELHVPLVMVLGHERCGAVAATIKGGEIPGHINTLVKAITPAVAHARTQPGDLLDNAVRENIKRVTQQLRASMPIATLLQEKKIQVVGARYDLDQGTVKITA